MRFSIPFEGSVAARDATVALLKKKFGTDGEPVEEFGKALTRLSDSPVVTMSVDALGDAVEIEVEFAKGNAGKRPRAGRSGGKAGGNLPGGRAGGRGSGTRPGGPGRPTGR